MTTTPTTTTTTTTMLQKAEAGVGHWVTLIKAHEKLLIVAIIALTLVHFGNKAYDAYGKHLQANQTATNAQISQLEKSNAQTQAQLDQLKATYDAQLKIDEAKIAAAKQTVIIKQKQDAALPLPELAKHWEELLVLTPGSITPQPNGTVAVTTDAAHTTVNELEKVGPLTDQLIATQDELKGCTDIRTKQDAQIAGLNNDIALEKTGRAEDAKLAKHNTRAAYLKGLKHGIIIGVVGTVAATIAILH
jgi:multidrug efflux pump subunit AcrA (membrane-fusion protein)